MKDESSPTAVGSQSVTNSVLSVGTSNQHTVAAVPYSFVGSEGVYCNVWVYIFIQYIHCPAKSIETAALKQNDWGWGFFTALKTPN